MGNGPSVLTIDDVHPAHILATPPECAPNHRHWKIWLVPLAVVGLLWFTPWYGNGELTWSMANKIAALAGLFIIALTFLIGPLSRLFPKYCLGWRCHRKTLGLTGFGLAAAHGIYSFAQYYKWDLGLMLVNNEKWVGGLAALLAFVIFLLMALTSTRTAVQKLGYKNWKALQMAGYAALFLSIVHFFILEIKADGVFKVRPLGYVVMAMAVLALLARALIWVLDLPGPKKFIDHFCHRPGADD